MSDRIKKLVQKKYSKSALDGMGKKELIVIARKRGLEDEGSKATLVKVILEDQGKQEMASKGMEVLDIKSDVVFVKGRKG